MVADLKRSLKRINSAFELSDADMDFVITSLRALPPNLDGIHHFLDIFRNCLVVPLQKRGKERLLRLFDLQNLENNQFIVTNQFTVDGIRPDKSAIVLEESLGGVLNSAVASSNGHGRW